MCWGLLGGVGWLLSGMWCRFAGCEMKGFIARVFSDGVGLRLRAGVSAGACS